MSKSILKSLRPKTVANILNGDATLLINRDARLYKATMKLIEEQGYATFFIYCTKEKLYGDEYLCKESRLKGKFNWYEFMRFDGKDMFEEDEQHKILNGKVVAKFTVRKVEAIKYANWLGHLDKVFTDNLTEEELLNKSCLSQNEIGNYLGINCNCLFGIKDGYSGGYAYHIEDLIIFDRPRELSEFKLWIKPIDEWIVCDELNTDHWAKPLTKAPQNFCYVESEDQK